MKITAIILVIGLFVFGFLIYKSKKNADLIKERNILGGQTKQQLADELRPLWKTEFKNAIESYYGTTEMKQQALNYYNQNHLGNLVGIAAINFVKDQWVDQAIKAMPNPLTVGWAVDYWLAKKLTEKGLKLKDPTVTEAIRLI